MLGEFSESKAACQELLRKVISLAKNEGVDTLDLSTVAISGTAAAKEGFLLNRQCVPSQIIARKDAYDFISAHERLSATFSRDRLHYYSRAADELEKDVTRLEELSAVLKRLDLFGGAE